LFAETPSNKTIIGKWIENGYDKSGSIEFKKNGIVILYDSNGKSLFPTINITYENITEVTPHQIYWNISYNGEMIRKPFCIYKIENDKLIMRDPIEYHRTLGGVDMGVSRYEIPKDFNGVIRVFKRK
jgi:hypothetical protein